MLERSIFAVSASTVTVILATGLTSPLVCKVWMPKFKMQSFHYGRLFNTGKYNWNILFQQIPDAENTKNILNT